jgi:peptidoglycan/xylan/chitin deacetylase (PgdA/CDA1 family)
MKDGGVTAIYFHNPNPRLLQRCLLWLTHKGYNFISADELCDIIRGVRAARKGSVWLSFDDGYRQWVNQLVPMVHKLKVPVTFFVPSGIVAGPGRFPWSEHSTLREALTVSELVQIARYPEVTIGSHTVSHAVTVCCTSEELRVELGDSRRTLESWTGRPVKSFAYPEGRFDGREVQALVEAGYELAATTEISFINSKTNPHRVPRFGVGDDVSFPEAICAMVGVWQPVIGALKRAVKAMGIANVGTESNDRPH